MIIGMAMASRGRADRALAVVQKARQLATGAVPLFLRVDDDDPQLEDYREMAEYGNVDVGRRLAKGSAPHINRAAMNAYEAGCDVVMQVADDQVFETPNWDSLLKAAITKACPPDGIGLFYTADGYLDDKNVSHPIVTRGWIEKLGCFYPAAYTHFYADTDLENIARRTNRLFYVPEVLIRHDKHGYVDALYQEIRGAGLMPDSRVYMKRGPERDALVAMLEWNNGT